ncbi:MAG: Hydrogenase transcriptional regulatory protein hupR1 [Verrucomicrobiales bacterium]|nr:Hydrogenase transcriptional regulatory protein hupR1 [Verrucomicrobiales bacterium]
MSTKILFVDDEANVLEGYQRNLRKRFAIDTALGGESALALMSKEGPYAVVVADMQMPGMNGVELLMQARINAPDTVRMMLTGNADQKTASEAVNKGHIYQFLNKPCSPEMMASALDSAIHQHRLVTAERELLENTLNGSIKLLTEVLSAAEPHSFGRGEVLRGYIRAFAEALQLKQTWDLELAAMLSQIGYMTIPSDLVTKARAGHGLTGPEKDMLLRVPEIGSKLLRNIPRLESVAKIVLYQDKNYDGTGFPFDSVAGEDIPVGSRILKVLSDLAQLEAQGVLRHRALEQMQSRAGLYDPRVLDTAFFCFDVYLTTPTSAKASSHAVPLQELKSGDTLSANVETRDGILIVGAGTKVSPMILEKLRNFEQLNGIKEPIHVLTT